MHLGSTAWATVRIIIGMLFFISLCVLQGVSGLMDITAGGAFLGLCDQKVHINLCPTLDGYGVMGIF